MMNSRGFTLVELLVVIAIISLLSSVILASLNSARTKASDAAVKAGVMQFRMLMELEYSEVGSYANLNKGWVGNGDVNVLCGARGYAGTRATEAVAICNSIRDAISNKSENNIYTGVNTGSFSNSKDYSIMAKLSSGKYFCAGSSGRNSDQGIHALFLAEGCYGNP